MAGTAARNCGMYNQPAFMTFGEFLNQIFPWFDAADANYNIGRNGLGGGCGDTAGTVAGFAGAQWCTLWSRRWRWRCINKWS
jgi:hypothetical protein